MNIISGDQFRSVTVEREDELKSLNAFIKLLFAAAFILSILKVSDQITWSWWLVASPAWVFIGAAFVTFAYEYLIAPCMSAESNNI